MRGVQDSAPIGAELLESRNLELGLEAFERVDCRQASVQVETFGWSDGCSTRGEVNACSFDTRSGFQGSPHTADTGNTSGHALDSESHCFDGRIDSGLLRFIVLASAEPKGKACSQDGSEESLHALSFGQSLALFS